MQPKTRIPARAMARFYQWLEYHRRCHKIPQKSCSRCHTLTSMWLSKSIRDDKSAFPAKDKSFV